MFSADREQFVVFAMDVETELGRADSYDPIEATEARINGIYRSKAGLESHFSGQFHGLVEAINNLSLMIFDPSYIPAEQK